MQNKILTGIAALLLILMVGCNKYTKTECLDVIIPEVCTEINELCEEEFIRMCELSCYEICGDIIDVTKVCNENCDCGLNE